MKLRLLRLKVSRATIAYCAAAALAVGLLYFAFTRGTGELRRDGVVYQMPVPYLSVQIGARENRTTFLTVGYPDLKTAFDRRGARFGWGSADRLGGGFSIPSTQDKNLWMYAVTFPRVGENFTIVEFFIP